MDDKQRVAQSYILTFYTNVQNIKTHYSSFLSLCLQLEQMYPETKTSNVVDMSDIPEEHKTQILNMNNDLRFYMQGAYFDFVGLVSHKNITCAEEVEKKIKELYSLLKKELFVDRDQVEEYILNLNHFMISGIMKELIDQSQAFVEDLYSSDEK